LNHGGQFLVDIVILLGIGDRDTDGHTDGDCESDAEESEDTLVAERVGTGGRRGFLVHVVFRGGNVGFDVS